MRAEQVERQALNDQQIAVQLQLHGVETVIRSVDEALRMFDESLVAPIVVVDEDMSRAAVLGRSLGVRRAG